MRPSCLLRLVRRRLDLQPHRHLAPAPRRLYLEIPPPRGLEERQLHRHLVPELLQALLQHLGQQDSVKLKIHRMRFVVTHRQTV